MMPPDSGGRRRRLYLFGALLSLSVALTAPVSATAQVPSTPSLTPQIIVFDECRMWQGPRRPYDTALSALHFDPLELMFARGFGKEMLPPLFYADCLRCRERVPRPSYVAVRAARPRAAAVTKLTRLARRYGAGQFT